MMALEPRAVPQPAEAEGTDAAGGFLARWSRRKLGEQPEPVPPQPEAAELANAPAVAAPDPASAAPEPIDPRTGKPLSELTDEDMPDIATLDANSDLRGFMSGKVSEALRMQALTKVFHSPKYNQICLCAEYADDYTNFLPMGNIVPHDLKQAIAREAGKLVQRLAERGIEFSPEEAEARMAREFRGEKLEPLPAEAEAEALPAPVLPSTAPTQQAEAAQPPAPSENP